MIAAVIAMVMMIVLVDQVVWRPIVAWSQRFKVEDVAGAVEPKSWVLDLVRRSSGCRSCWRLFDPSEPIADRRPASSRGRAAPRTARPVRAAAVANVRRPGGRNSRSWRGAAGGDRLGRLVDRASCCVELPLDRSVDHEDWRTVLLALGASFLRTTTAVLLGAAWTLPVGHSHRPLAALVGAAAAGDPGRRQLSRADAVSPGDGPAVGSCESISTSAARR